jgi:N,N'-diacetyllegionaminate synthase
MTPGPTSGDPSSTSSDTPPEIVIGERRIGEGWPAFLIAEAGVNHDGSLDRAKALAEAAAGAGADAVKFQLFRAAALVRRTAPKAGYQDRNIGPAKSQYAMLEELEIPLRAAAELQAHCRSLGILFLATPYDFESLDTLARLEVPACKLASIEVVHHPLIRRAAALGKPLILSTGMASEKEVAQAVAVYRQVRGHARDLVLLQCNTNYPSRPEDQNLRGLHVLRRYVPIVGFSDHTPGNEASIAAVAMGARVFERHLTLDRGRPGPDHAASLEPPAFAEFVRAVRTTEAILGEERKAPSGGEVENLLAMRRSICAREDIPKGTVLTEALFAYKRPGDGLLPTEENIARLVGRRTRDDIAADANITLESVLP